MLDFTVSGRRVTLMHDGVQRTVASLDPDPIRTHAVVVDGKRYPVKQAFSAASGMDRLDFTTNQARHVLARLGFEVVRVN